MATNYNLSSNPYQSKVNLLARIDDAASQIGSTASKKGSTRNSNIQRTAHSILENQYKQASKQLTE
jgi:hypothetical protein